ncbi:NAD-dependent epimerase [Cytophagales bacterium WSM2-2]|nr:NAD-dependent epimerase [Cytophagales bacterium WSM2-2]
MNKKIIVIAGGTGFLGNVLVKHLSKDYELIILTRGRTQRIDDVQHVHWDGRTIGEWSKELEGADVLINLNGKSVDCRYTEKNKKLIYSTRLEATAVLGEAVQLAKNPPRLWINAASATIYRHSMDKEMDEFTGEIGTGFSVDVCLKWEEAVNRIKTPFTRKVLIRTGIVLGKKDGPLKPLRLLAQLGLGGKHGPGDQYFSWLHEDDFAHIISFIMANASTSGAYNVTAPTPVSNQQVMKALRSSLKIPIGLPMPEWLLKLGAVLIGTETELILKSRRVIPLRLLQAGYKFKHESIEAAMNDLVR